MAKVPRRRGFSTTCWSSSPSLAHRPHDRCRGACTSELSPPHRRGRRYRARHWPSPSARPSGHPGANGWPAVADGGGRCSSWRSTVAGRSLAFRCPRARRSRRSALRPRKPHEAVLHALTRSGVKSRCTSAAVVRNSHHIVEGVPARLWPRPCGHRRVEVDPGHRTRRLRRMGSVAMPRVGIVDTGCNLASVAKARERWTPRASGTDKRKVRKKGRAGGKRRRRSRNSTGQGKGLESNKRRGVRAKDDKWVRENEWGEGGKEEGWRLYNKGIRRWRKEKEGKRGWKG